jgi:SAM-dependent methyltransferase
MMDLISSIRMDPIGTLRKSLPKPIFKLVAKSYTLVMTPLWAIEKAQQSVFERRFSVSIGGTVSLDSSKLADSLLGSTRADSVDSVGSSEFINGGDNTPYQPCGWLPMRRSLKDLNPVATDVFVDLGSGKGQMLIIAALHPFKRVTGVEYDQELAELSRRNIKGASPRFRAREIEVITADALEWDFEDDISIVFMFNPFVGQTFQAVVGKVFASFDRNPRELHINYAFPWEHDWLLTTGRVVVETVRPSRWPPGPWWWRTGHVIVSYRVVGVTENGHRNLRNRRRLIRPSRAVRRWSEVVGHDFILDVVGREAVDARLKTKDTN